MKKTIASLAILASAQAALSMPVPRDPNAPQPKINHVCLKTYGTKDGSKIATCDASYINDGKTLLANGCAKDQIELTIVGDSPIMACMPPGMAQL